MIGAAIIDGKLRITAEVTVSRAWSPDRIARLIELIQDYIKAAEIVDSAAKEIDKNVATATRRPRP